MDNIDDIEILEVFDESELPVKAEKGKKYYINLGGSKKFSVHICRQFAFKRRFYGKISKYIRFCNESSI